MLRSIEYIIGFIVLMLVQVFIFDNINIAGYVTPYIYIMFIMILPMQISSAILLLVGFGMGAMIDLFTGNMGLCAMTATFIAFIRPGFLTLVSGREVVNNGGMPSAKSMGTGKFLLYIVLMTLAYNTPFFLLERMTFTGLGYTAIRILLSTVFSVIVIYIGHLLLIRKESSWR